MLSQPVAQASLKVLVAFGPLSFKKKQKAVPVTKLFQKDKILRAAAPGFAQPAGVLPEYPPTKIVLSRNPAVPAAPVISPGPLASEEEYFTYCEVGIFQIMG